MGRVADGVWRSDRAEYHEGCLLWGAGHESRGAYEACCRLGGYGQERLA